MSYRETALNQSAWVNRFQVLQWVAVVGFFLTMILSSFLPTGSIYLALFIAGAVIVGLGIPKNYRRDNLKSQREVKVEEMYRAFIKLPRGETVTLDDLDKATIDRFFEILEKRNVSTEYEEVTYDPDAGVIALKKLW